MYIKTPEIFVGVVLYLKVSSSACFNGAEIARAVSRSNGIGARQGGAPSEG